MNSIQMADVIKEKNIMDSINNFIISLRAFMHKLTLSMFFLAIIFSGCQWLEQHPEAIIEVEKIGEEVAEEIIEAELK